MTEQTAAELRDAYLRALDAALAELPHGIAVELREGVAEELTGLDAHETASRIRELGDPREVALAAAAESDAAPPRDGTIAAPAPAAAGVREPAPRPYLVDTRGFALTGALVLGFGGFLVPFAGWVVGASLVTSSRFWYRREKAFALLAPVVTAVVGLLVTWLFMLPAAAAEHNPLVPTLFGSTWMVLAIAALAAPLSGVWLLVRLRDRTEPVTWSRLDRLTAE